MPREFPAVHRRHVNDELGQHARPGTVWGSPRVQVGKIPEQQFRNPKPSSLSLSMREKYITAERFRFRQAGHLVYGGYPWPDQCAQASVR